MTTASLQATTFRLPFLHNEKILTQSYSTKGLYSKNDIFTCIRDDIVPRSLETFCESTKEYLTNEQELKKSKLVQQTNGKYVFINENGICLNKYGPFWPKIHFIIHALPTFIKNYQDTLEYYADETLDLVTETNLGHDKYPSEWKNNILIYDTQKSPRVQEPLIFSHIFSPTLIFESRFESGNLRQVRRRGQFEYELLLRTDLFTEKHTQWYFFKVSNMLANTTYRFRIINLRKPTSLYSNGLKPLMYSMRHAHLNNIGWYRTGHHISYYQNINHRMNPLLKTNETYYELDFQIEFPHCKDECYLAHCYPYTYSDLKETIDALEEKCANKRCFLRDFLCETRAGNTCFLLTITDFSNQIYLRLTRVDQYQYCQHIGNSVPVL